MRSIGSDNNTTSGKITIRKDIFFYCTLRYLCMCLSFVFPSVLIFFSLSSVSDGPISHSNPPIKLTLGNSKSSRHIHVDTRAIHVTMAICVDPGGQQPACFPVRPYSQRNRICSPVHRKLSCSSASRGLRQLPMLSFSHLSRSPLLPIRSQIPSPPSGAAHRHTRTLTRRCHGRD